MKLNKIYILGFISIFATQSWSATKSFNDIWGNFYQKSLKQKSVKEELDANELALSRSQRHWLPRVYASGQWFRTSDPTQVFFNHLGQRSVIQKDFQLEEMNHPGFATAKYGVIGVDLPLFEGGVKHSQESMYESLLRASHLEVIAKKSEEFAELGRHYGSLILYLGVKDELSKLKGNLEKIIDSYQIGSNSNVLGYSGLLGLRGVQNRIEAILYEFNLKETNSKNWINEKVEIVEEWNPVLGGDFKLFIKEHFSHTSLQSYSSQLQAEEFKVATLESMADMEKARFLPRVGLFGQSNLYNGPRNTSSSQTYGIYLMWDIFNSDSFGRLGEARARSMSAQTKMGAFKQEEHIALKSLNESKQTLEKSLEIIDKSDVLLKEQSANAMKLFRSGLVNALQLAEVLNRRVDLIKDKSTAEASYLDVSTRLYQINN